MFKHQYCSLLALSLLIALPAQAGTPKQHPRVTPAPRMAVRAEPVANRAPVQRVNTGEAQAIGGLMLSMNGHDLRLHGVRVPTESKVRNNTVQQHLANMIAGKTLKCLTVGIDIDGVPLVACETSGITNIALKMLQSGFADVDAKQVANTPVAALYTQTARMAKEQKLAIWGGRGAGARATVTAPAAPAPKPAPAAEMVTEAPITPPEPPQDVVKAVDFAPIGLVETPENQAPAPTTAPESGVSPWMIQRLGADADPLGLETAPAPETTPETTPETPTETVSATPAPEDTDNNIGMWILAAGLLLTGAATIGSVLSWRRHKAMLEEIAWNQSRASVAARRQSDRQQQKRQKATINLEEDLLSLSQTLSGRADIARLTATGPGGDTVSDLRSLSIFVPDTVAKPDQIAADIPPETARQLRKISNAVQELENRITQCADLAADGRLRDRPSALFMALSQRMDAIAADARALTISLKQQDWQAAASNNTQDQAEPEYVVRKQPSVQAPRRAAMPALSATRADAGGWGQPDWATA